MGFITKTLLAMKNRLPYNEMNIQKTLAIYLKEVHSIEDLTDLAKRLPNIISSDLEIAFIDEVDSFSLKYGDIVKNHKESGMSIIKRWKILKADFPLLCKLASALLTIPYSTSNVESLFSEFKAVKTAYRNRLTVDNLEAGILSDHYFRGDNTRILPEMFDRYFDMWKKKRRM